MRKLSKHARLSHVLLLAFILSMITTSFAQPRIVGLGAKATSVQRIGAYSNSEAMGWQAVAAAICAAYFAGWVVGTVAHHAWDLVILTEDPELQRLAAVAYDPNDFSSYDS